MKYIFFDIECACVYKNVAKICAFGYCITDENFNLIEQKELLINPKGRFHLTNEAGQGLVLPYNYDAFKNYKDFSYFYKEIQELLQSEDMIKIGHATINDAKFLKLEIGRYKLRKLKFKFYDTQIFYMASTFNFERYIGLEELVKILHIETKVEHSALKDAYITMQITKVLCKNEGISLEEFIKKHGIIAGELHNDKIKDCKSLQQQEYQLKKQKEQQERARKRGKFHVYANSNKFISTTNLLKGLQFTFENAIEENFSQAQELLTIITKHGATYTAHTANCTAYLASSKESLQRRRDIYNLQKIGQIQKIYTIEELKIFLDQILQ